MRYVFGYGSLVNAATHNAPLTPALLSGYRRVWHHTDLREIAFLSIEEAPGATIAGACQPVANDDFEALDLRETGYTRRDAVVSPSPGETVVYQVPKERRLGGAPHPLIMSYIDVVVGGFLDVFGSDGVADFFATTDGWDVRILDDRTAPIYPRHLPLRAEVRDLTDAHLARLPAVVEQA